MRRYTYLYFDSNFTFPMATGLKAVGGARAPVDSPRSRTGDGGAERVSQFAEFGLTAKQDAELSGLKDHLQQLLRLHFSNLVEHGTSLSRIDSESGLVILVGETKMSGAEVPEAIRSVLDKAVLAAGRSAVADVARSTTRSLLMKHAGMGGAALFAFGLTRAALMSQYCLVADTEFYGREVCHNYVATCMEEMNTSLRATKVHRQTLGRLDNYAAMIRKDGQDRG